jgi:hypothetical protein
LGGVVDWVGEVVDREDGEGGIVVGGEDVDAMGDEWAGEVDELQGDGFECLRNIRLLDLGI